MLSQPVISGWLRSAVPPVHSAGGCDGSSLWQRRLGLGLCVRVWLCACSGTAAMFSTALRRFATAPVFSGTLAGGVVLGAALSARPADAEKNVRSPAAALRAARLPRPRCACHPSPPAVLARGTSTTPLQR